MAQEYIKKVSNPFINITVEFLELSKTKDYEDYASLFNLELGDIVTVKHEKLGIYSELRVIKMVKDLLRPINTKVELGNPLNTIVSKLDLTSIVERLESKIEGAQNAVILKKNNENIIITATSFYQAIAVGISALADTNLTCNLIINGSASADLILYLKCSLDGEYYEFQPSQNLALGENIVNLTIPIPQVTAGSHAFVVEMKTSTGSFNIEKNNLQVMIEGRHLEGGLSPSLPRAEVMQFILYALFLSKISSYKDNMKTEINIEQIANTEIQFADITSYSECLSKDPTNMNTAININMAIAGISQRANSDFYLNLDVDRWVKHFSGLQNKGDGTWETVNYITVTELTDIQESEQYSSLGNGLVYETTFGDRSEYSELLNLAFTFVNH